MCHHKNSSQFAQLEKENGAHTQIEHHQPPAIPCIAELRAGDKESAQGASQLCFCANKEHDDI